MAVVPDAATGEGAAVCCGDDGGRPRIVDGWRRSHVGPGSLGGDGGGECDRPTVSLLHNNTFYDFFL